MQDAMAARMRSGWDVYEIARLDDPYPVWAELRESDPVHDAGGRVWLVTRRDLAEQVLRDPRLQAGAGVAESFGEAEGLLADVMAAWLMSLDGEAHQYARNLVSREFTPRRVAALAPVVGSLASGLVADWLERALREPADLVEALAFALPSRVMCHLFRIELAEWRERVEPLFRPPPGTQLPQGGAIQGLAEYFDELVRAPDEIDPKSLLSLLSVPDPEAGELSDLEVVANCVLLVTAGIDTTTALIANSVLCLLQNPDQLALIRTDAERVPAAIEETLRFEPPALSASRHAVEKFSLGGREIPAGSQLLISIAAANRDPRRYADPDRFDVTRSDIEPLTFGGGRHFCLGAALARLEGRAALDALLATGHELELDSFRWRKDNPTVRGPAELRVRARPRTA
jgi:cytochrome P450